MGLADSFKALCREGAAPQTPLAALGLGALVMAIDDHSIPAIFQITVRSNLIPFLIAMPLMLAVFYRYANPTRRHVPLAFALAVGVVGSCCYVAMPFNAADYPQSWYVAIKAASKFCEGTLLFFWMKALVAFGARRSAATFSASIVLFAALNALTLLLRQDIVYALVVALPLVSASCLVVYLRLSRTTGPAAQTEADALYVYPCTDDAHCRPYFLFGAFIPFICFAIAFGRLHFIWVGLQDQASLSLAVQVGTLFGSLLGACMMLCFVSLFWTRENVHILKASLPMALLLAMWFAGSSSEVWVLSYLTLLNITHKLVYLLMWLTPFMFDLGRSRLTPFCLSFTAFEIGRAISGATATRCFGTSVDAVTALALTALILCSVVPSLVYNSLEKRAEGRVAITQATRVTRFRNAVQTISAQHDLTPRETEILQYLGKGYTSAHVADKLCISAATAKTHQKNIYTKLKLHSQQDLIALVDSAISEQYERERRQEQGVEDGRAEDVSPERAHD